MKKFLSIVILPMIILSAFAFRVSAETELEIDARSGILIEASTGKVLFEQNADEALPPASVTKIMTLLLVMEAIDDRSISLDDTVTASAHAASMGGSQIFLKEGEQMSVEDMIKSVVISSANDAALALAEHIAGSEEAFVSRMNRKAEELGMKNTHFENTNGLDDTVSAHLISARDIATMSAELITKHPKILEYSSIWTDSVRDGAFGLTNTNRLIRFYRGANGLKTGSTSKAGFCISATAERDGMTLIAVVMGSPTRDIRNAETKKLLDLGFANYTIYKYSAESMGSIRVLGGTADAVEISHGEFSTVIETAKKSGIEILTELPEEAPAPIKAGDTLGKLKFISNGEELGSVDITAESNVPKLGFFGIFTRILKGLCLAG